MKKYSHKYYLEDGIYKIEQTKIDGHTITRHYKLKDWNEEVLD